VGWKGATEIESEKRNVLVYAIKLSWLTRIVLEQTAYSGEMIISIRFRLHVAFIVRRAQGLFDFPYGRYRQ